MSERLQKLHADWVEQEIAAGRLRPGQRSRIVKFDDEMFNEINLMAIKNGISFTEQVRILCEWGLEAESNV